MGVYLHELQEERQTAIIEELRTQLTQAKAEITSLKRQLTVIPEVQYLVANHYLSCKRICQAADLFANALADISADRLSRLTDQSSSNIEDELENLSNLFQQAGVLA